jgi:hypothetical protein
MRKSYVLQRSRERERLRWCGSTPGGVPVTSHRGYVPIHRTARKLTIDKDEVTLKNGSSEMCLLVSGAEYLTRGTLVLMIAYLEYVTYEKLV